MSQFTNLLFGGGKSRYKQSDEEEQKKKQQPFYDASFSQAELAQAQEMFMSGQSARQNKKEVQQTIQKTAEENTRIQYGSIFERVGDLFEANSPQDMAKRKARGEPERYQSKSLIDRAKGVFQGEQIADITTFKPEDLVDRTDYFARAGIDINQAIADKKAYDRFVQENKGKSLSKLTLEGRIPEAVKNWESIKTKVEDTERDYQRMLNVQKEGQNPLDTIGRGIATGAADPLLKAPGNLDILVGKALDVLSPEGSSIGNYGEQKYQEGKAELDKINQKIVDEGFGPSTYDNPLIYNIGSGVGSLGASVAAGGVAGTSAAAALFGLTAAGPQTIGAEEAGKGDLQQLVTGISAGLLEGGLEKVGLDKFLKPGSGGLVKKTVTRMITEGAQEASQSLAQSGVTATYSDVDLGNALKQALYEGGIGAIVGGGAGLAFSVSENLQAQGVEPDVAIETGMNVQDKVQAIIQEENSGPVTVDVKTPQKKSEMGLVNTKPLVHYTSIENAKAIRLNGFKIKSTKSVQGDAIYFLNDESYSNLLSKDQKKGNEPIRVTLDNSSKILDLNNKPSDAPGNTSGNKLRKYALKNGYDGVTDGVQTAIYNTDKIDILKTADSELKPVKQEQPKSKYPDAIYKEYSDYIQSIEADMTGGQMIPDGEGGYRRTTSHTPFYREYFATHKRAPSKQAWLDYAKEQIDSGRADPDFYDYAKTLTSNSKTNDLALIESFAQTKAKRPARDYRREAMDLKTPQELIDLADNLNKAGQVSAVLRKGQLKKKTAAGTFSPSDKRSDRLIKLQDKVLKDPSLYPTVLAHELSHAIEYNVNGDTKSTYKLFGELTNEEQSQIENELKAIVNNIEGEKVAKSKPQYFYKPTEMFARYIETMVLAPGQAEVTAPLTSEKFQQLIIKNEMVSSLVDAIANKIDKGWKGEIKVGPTTLTVPNLLKDTRQIYRKHLGKTAGDAAYDAEVIRRAEVNRAVNMIDDLIKRKFKGIKDKPETLFRAAEGILITENGKPQFGTTARKYIELEPGVKEEMEMVMKGMISENMPKSVVKAIERYQQLKAEGWQFETFKSKTFNGKEQESIVMSRPRYTAEQAKGYFDSLSDGGKQLIIDFTSARQEAKDDFNRELLKDVYKIETDLEGWVHHFFEGSPYSTSSNVGLKRKTAAARKQRGEKEGYIEDFKKSMQKAITETEIAEINNQFITDQLARISKPIAEGQQPDKGWVEVWADEKGGLRLPGEGGITVIQSENGKSFKKPERRFQVPVELADHYRTIRHIPQDISTTTKIANALGKYWGINVLTHMGTTGTNYVSGGIQYGLKILDDFYFDVLSADYKFSKTTSDLAAPVQALLPKNWSEAPTWMYGGYRSTFAGQFASGTRSEIMNKNIDRYGNNVLKLFGAVETYWKRTIALSEGSNLSDAQKRSVFKRLQADEKKLIAELNKPIDLFALDYDNVPFWLANFDRGGGKLVKPFMKYPYKYTKMITNHVAAPFDKSLDPRERAAKAFALGTIVALIMAWYDEQEKKSNIPVGTEDTPYPLRPQGRIYIGSDEARQQDLFVRVAKYPFFNLTALGESIVKRNFDQTTDLLRDQFGTIGPGMDLALLAIGRKNEFNRYTPTSAIIGQQVATLIPGFRVLNDLGKIIDPYKRQPENFVQGIGINLPVWGSEEQRAKLRGDRKTLKIPNETDAPREMTAKAKTTIERDRTETWGDVLLSTLTGIYINRISPEEAKKQELRELRSKAESQVRTFLIDGKEEEAQAVANEYGLIIKQGTIDYYRRQRGIKKEDTKIKGLDIPGFQSSSSSKKSSGLTTQSAPTSDIKTAAFTHAQENYGWNNQELASLDTLINNESGWRPDAQNPTSTAFGLFQFLDMHKQPGGYLPNGNNSSIEEQIAGGLRYIRDRYGTPSNALAAWLSRYPHWY